MSSFFEDLFDRFHELHADATKAIQSVPDEALDWIAGQEMNSLGVLVVHLTGAERFWIGAVALDEASDRVREQEFQARGLTGVELVQRLSSADEYARAALQRFSMSDLDARRKSGRSDRIFTVGWCLLHALEHTALHVGHIQLTCQLWMQKAA